MSGKVGDNIFRASGLVKAAAAGRTGTVDWQTGSIKTGDFTAESGKGYFVNTTSGAVTVTLPGSPSAGDIVSIKDYAGTAGTNAITIGLGGSKIAGGCNAGGDIETDNAFVTLVYVDGTQGWLPTDDSNSDISGALTFISATGGTITTVCTDYKVHTFDADGTFTVCTAGVGPALATDVSYIVTAGGGGGGWCTGGGGGAGGFREAKVSGDPYTASPLDAGTGITVTATGYPITVGGGGTPGGPPGSAGGGTGSNSIFSTITSAGGGGAGSRGPGNTSGKVGGSGGGGANTGQYIAFGNTPQVSPPQGNSGGVGSPGASVNDSGGGGGATERGEMGPAAQGAGDGGDGATSSITGSPVARGGGGGGGSGHPSLPQGAGGTGGGGTGTGPGGGQTAGGTNLGGGGGGGSHPHYPTVPGAAGGSGVVIIRYKFQ